MDQRFAIDFQRKVEELLNGYQFSSLPASLVHLRVVITKNPGSRGMYRCGATNITSEEMQARIKKFPVLLDSIDNFGFSIRVRKCLFRFDVRTVGQLVQCNSDDLLKIRNFGQKCLDEVRQKLAEIDLSLAGEG